jgi:hypothetical protein
VAGAGAIVVQRSSTSPIGEGEVFVADAATAEERIARSRDPNVAVRQARNELDVEAVSLVGNDGVVVISTSDPFVGRPVENSLVADGVEDRRFIALAAAIEEDLWLDGVVGWPGGSVLYQVAAPLKRGGSVMIHYDVSQLLGRRTPPGGSHPLLSSCWRWPPGSGSWEGQCMWATGEQRAGTGRCSSSRRSCVRTPWR